MADLTGYTPIYIRTTGNDTTGNGSLASPYATAQKAFDIAIVTASGNYVLDFGAGNFNGITLSQNWPARIAIRGAGPSQSFLGNITANGNNAIYNEIDVLVSPATNGHNITIISNKTINLGNISSNGGEDAGYYSGASGSGGAINLTDTVVSNINSNGANIFITGTCGNGGNITLTNSDSSTIYANGGSGNDVVPGSGGNISLINSTGTNLSANGGNGNSGNGQVGGNGTVLLDNSVSNNIFSYASDYIQYNNTTIVTYGSIILTNNSYTTGTLIGNITANGFTGSNPSGNFYFGLGDRLIHIDPSGNDTTGNGSSESPYATAQKAFQIAMSTGNAAVINLSSGNFGVVSLDSAAPDKDLSQYIRLSGISEGLSSISALTANSGQKISLTANNISINNIIASGSNLFCYGNYPIPTGMICASGNFIDLKRGKNFNRNNLLGLI